MDIKKEYERWLANATADGDVLAELKTLDDAKIEDAFYRDLAFGTGGLRGVIGAGTNRMNVYTVAKASQGLADYLKKNYEKPSVVIGYDSRIKSDVFAKTAAEVLAAPGAKVLMKSGRQLPETLAALADAGLLSRSAMVCNCGLPNEEVWPDLSACDASRPAGYFATILVKER